MFSGLVRELAEIKGFKDNTLEVLTNHKANIGDSIAINGACLSVIRHFSGGVAMELSKHTQQSIAIENYKAKSIVHLEPALSVGDRLDGHIVQGHIDGIGTITKIEKHSDASDFYIESSSNILDLMIPKGSVCIDGISLTIIERLDSTFKLTIIPHTMKTTLFGSYKVGRRVNIESDIITRSVVNALKTMLPNSVKSTTQSKLWSHIDAQNLSF